MNDINKIILLISLVSFNLFFAQVGIGTTTLDPSALLELKSNTSGVLIPRMIQDEKNAIDDPATGLLIYQTDVFPGFYYYDGVWKLLTNNQESIKGVNTSVVLNGTNLEVTDGKSTITTDLSSLKELPTPTAIGAMIYWDGSAWVEVAPTVNDGATLKMIGGVPTWDGGTPPPPAIGDVINGGLVFWIDPTDPNKGKVCALNDSSSTLSWSDAVSYCNNYENLDTGTGIYNDWYLPALGELNLMWENLADSDEDNNNGGPGYPGNIGDFINNRYWSSTEVDGDSSWRQSFLDGNQTDRYKSEVERVRAVRAF